MVPLQILYQDPWLVAVNKPAGLLVHRSAIDRYETQFAVQLLRDQLGQRVFPVHRLDKPTSGVLLFALSSEAARRCAEAFEQRSTLKQYCAVVRGWVKEAERIDYPLLEQADVMTDAKAAKDKPAQEAITDYKPLATAEVDAAVGRYATARYTLLSLTPRTGRKHQLRRHMKHIFHPIVGDTSHGDGKHNQFFRDHFGVHRLLLAAESLQLEHPFTEQVLHIKAPLDDAFQLVLNELGMNPESRC